MIGDLIGYLHLDSPSGCVELMNSCRTMAYIQNQATGALEARVGCEDCCCRHHDEGYTVPVDDLAPWYDPSVPASAEFLGLIGDLTIGQFSDGLGNTTRRLTFSGLALSRCNEGRVWGNQWIHNVLVPFCGGCTALQGTVFTHCGRDVLPDDPLLNPPNPRPDMEVGLDCCEEPTVEAPILGLTTDVPDLVDTGQRQLLRLRYVRDSLTQVDIGSEWPGCYGTRITFSFDVEDSYAYHPPIVVCDRGGTTEADNAGDGIPVFDQCVCKDTPLLLDEFEDCGRCGVPCACLAPVPDAGLDHDNGSAALDRIALCRWSEPICFGRETCVTPALPYQEATPVVTVEAGATDVQFRLTAWDAHPGLPDPRTCQGEEIYRVRAPLTEPLLVTVPAGSTMVLDGSTQQATLFCDGEGSAGQLVTTQDGSSFRLPTVTCNRRLWLAIDFDCANPPSDDFRYIVEMSGRDRL